VTPATGNGRAGGGSRLTMRVPADYDLPRDVCSYGYFILAPNNWDPARRALTRPLELSGGASAVRITQAGGRGSDLAARFDRRLDRAEQSEARALIHRMLRLNENERDIRGFHRVDPRWRRSGRGRLFRSPTLFEDVVKTVTSCNVAWPSTIAMNQRLCDVLGRPSPSGLRAFPTAAKIARTRTGTLRGRCRVGYRDERLIALAKRFRGGEIDEGWLEDSDTPSEEVFRYLIELPGIGPYAAGNIMQLLGRYDRLALDTESVRHGRVVLGFEGNDRSVLKQLEAHFERFGDQRFRSYWFELWSYYESKRGPATRWDRETTGRSFTAALLKD